MTSESIDAKIRNSKILWALPSIVIILITIQSLLQLRGVPLKQVPLVGESLSELIHNNTLLSKAANEFFYQNTKAIAVVFLFFTLCWVLQYVCTFPEEYRHREYAFGSSVFGSLFFIVLFIAVYVPLFELPGFVIEKILFFGIPVGVVASLVQSYRLFPWKEIITDEIFQILHRAEGIINNTKGQVKDEFGRIADIDEISFTKILNTKRDIETSCRELLSEVNDKKREIREKKDISELNNLLPVAENLLERAEKNERRIDDVKNEIKNALIKKVDTMYAKVTNLGSEINCPEWLTLTNLPLFLREVNIPGIGNIRVEEVPSTLKSMIEEEEKSAGKFKDVFSVVEIHLANVRRYIQDKQDTFLPEYNRLNNMIMNIKGSITNIQNDVISKKLKYLYIEYGSNYNKFRLVKETVNDAKKDFCNLQFEDAMWKLNNAKENIWAIDQQIDFIRAMVAAVENEWPSIRISISETAILDKLSEEFSTEYGVKYSIEGDKLKIEYGITPIIKDRGSKTEEITTTHPDEVKAILYTLRNRIEENKDSIIILSKKKDLPESARKSGVLKEFKSLMSNVFGEDVKCHIHEGVDEFHIDFGDLDPNASIDKVIEVYEEGG